MKHLRWIIPVVCVVSTVLTLFSCLVLPTNIVSGYRRSVYYGKLPEGWFDKEEHFDTDGIQDFTHYCKYFYDSPDAVFADERYKSVAEVGEDTVRGYFENFRDWMEAADRLDEYDFSEAQITPDDRVYIINKLADEGTQWFYADYDVFFFDTETRTLYYIHSNI